MIFQHDQPLNPEDCGSVLVDLHGEVVGVNIARVSRVDTYAIPADFVARLLKTVDFDALKEKGSPGS
jgi:S1-C subfamily serine protease